jgi:hypothetical protein
MTCCLSKVFSATSAARERSVSRIVASTAFVTSRSIRQEYPAVCSRPGSLRHEQGGIPSHSLGRTEFFAAHRRIGKDDLSDGAGLGMQLCMRLRAYAV